MRAVPGQSFTESSSSVCERVLGVADWAHEALFVCLIEKALCKKLASCNLTSVIAGVRLSTSIVLKGGVYVNAFLSGFYCEPALQRPVSVSCMNLELLSGLGCDGWAEEDQGIPASACSSFVLSSVEDAVREKNINLVWLLILHVTFTWYANLCMCYCCSCGHFIMQNTMFPLCSHIIITFQREGFIYLNR